MKFQALQMRGAQRHGPDVWRRRGVAFWLSVLTLLFAFTLNARAQDNATITGIVTDPSGAVVPNAAITLTNPATGQTRETVSNSAGSFRFANVGVGSYSLTGVAQGFQKYTKTNLVVNVAQTQEADITLTVGSQAQTAGLQLVGDGVAAPVVAWLARHLLEPLLDRRKAQAAA